MKSSTSRVLGISLVAAGAALSLAGMAAAADSPAASPATARSAGAGLAGESPAAASTPSEAAQPAFELEADGVTYGMSADQVARLYDRWWDRHFVAKYRKTNPGPKTKELDYELEEQKKVLRRIANFDGRMVTYDKSEFHDEFAHGNGESMNSTRVLRRAAGTDPSKAVAYTRRFFYFQDKLWKIYDEYQLEPQSPLGADFKSATDHVAASLGPSAKRTRAPASQWETVLFEAGPQRVRVIKLGADRVAVVRSDSAMTKAVLDSRAQHAPVPEGGLDPDTRAALK